MRKLTKHIVDGDSANHQLEITVMDEPGAGGASHLYVLGGFNTTSNPSDFTNGGYDEMEILFQNGPIKEVGVNGLTHEVLLAVLIDRMEGFQAGPYACDANAVALEHLKNALSWLQLRTRERIIRGVEGSHAK